MHVAILVVTISTYCFHSDKLQCYIMPFSADMLVQVIKVRLRYITSY